MAAPRSGHFLARPGPGDSNADLQIELAGVFSLAAADVVP
jgi:hypothetical protein